MQTQRRIRRMHRLSCPHFSSRQISRVTANWKSKMPEMHPNLIRATGQRTRFDERGPVSITLHHAKFSPRSKPLFHIHLATAEFSRFSADRRVTTESIFERLSL